MKKNTPAKYSLNLTFEHIKLPPFEDILIVGSKTPQGKIGVSKAFEYLVPDEFEYFEIEDERIEAVFVNKMILNKIDKETIIKILSENVFPYTSARELIKVDFKIKLSYDAIEGTF
ncbi:MAG: hypothetical protein P1P88_19995 [Bacteroidales bacterium]|nr:hypothetical protein [Bacteroidales bacterium]